jgi:hypothetical protein
MGQRRTPSRARTGERSESRRRHLFKDEAMTLAGVTGPRRAASLLGVLGGLLLGLVGCSHTTQSRAQSAEEDDRYKVQTIGDITVVGNAEPVPLGGVGLVVGLEGTGGPTAPGDSFRAMFEDQMRKENVKNIKELLNSPDVAVVIVEGQLPAGARKGDTLDVVVKLPPGSRATSLRGGYLKRCWLYNYDFARHLSPQYTGSRGMLLGHRLAWAEGAVLVGLGAGDEALRLKQGRIWAGGHSRIDQPFGLMMNRDQQFVRMTSAVADRINETFHAGLRGVPDTKLAAPQRNLGVALRVPPQYRFNLPRFLRVVRLIPVREVADLPAGEGAGRRSYRQRVAADLLDPARTVTAALRLEALGAGSIGLLKEGLRSPHPLVRFCAAEAMAYLGSPSSGEELARAVVEQPALRAFGLTAMASLDEAVCHVKLRELLLTAKDDETRYGAFRALRALDERNSVVAGELLNDSFWLHRVAPDTPGLVHVSSTRRAEVVLFGEEPRLQPPFSFLAGEFAITATEDDTRCTVSRFPLHGTPARKQCALTVEEVLRSMAELGATYPEVIALLQQAETCRSLSCRVRCDALPQATSVFELAQAGRSAGGESAELLAGVRDLGVTPTLYELGLPSRSQQVREQETALRDRGTQVTSK